MRTILEEVLQEKVTIREGERTRTMPRIDALMRTIMNRALRGDTKAVQSLLMLIRATGLDATEREPLADQTASAEAEALLFDYLKRHGVPAPQLGLSNNREDGHRLKPVVLDGGSRTR